MFENVQLGACVRAARSASAVPSLLASSTNSTSNCALPRNAVQISIQERNGIVDFVLDGHNDRKFRLGNHESFFNDRATSSPEPGTAAYTSACVCIPEVNAPAPGRMP
jgi:hypothetical protein